MLPVASPALSRDHAEPQFGGEWFAIRTAEAGIDHERLVIRAFAQAAAGFFEHLLVGVGDGTHLADERGLVFVPEGAQHCRVHDLDVAVDARHDDGVADALEEVAEALFGAVELFGDGRSMGLAATSSSARLAARALAFAPAPCRANTRRPSDAESPSRQSAQSVASRLRVQS